MRRKVNDPGNHGQPEGRYANYFEIGHNAFEFLLDFGQFYLDEPESRLHTRIILNPFYARMLMGVLQEAIGRYEQTFGRIAAEAPEREKVPEAAEPGKPAGRAGISRLGKTDVLAFPSSRTGYSRDSPPLAYPKISQIKEGNRGGE
jgi:hypothetical protein